MSKKLDKSYSTYEALLKRFNKLRKQISTIHKGLEEFTPSSRMPSLVLPQRVKKIRKSSLNNISNRRLYNIQVKYLKSVVDKGLQGMMKDYKWSFLELYREYIIKEEPSIGGRYNNLYYSEDQKANADPKMALFMRIYNKFVTMNPTVFFYLHKSGRIPSFKQLYNEFAQDFEIDESFVAQAYMATKYAGYLNQKEVLRILEETNKEDLRRRINYVEGDIRKGLETIKKNRRS